MSHTCLEIFDLVEFQFVWPTSIYLSSHISMWSSILPSPLKKYVWHYSTVSQEKTKIIGFLHSFPYTMNVFKQIASEVQIECVMRTTLQIFWDKSSVPHCRQEFFIRQKFCNTNTQKFNNFHLTKVHQTPNKSWEHVQFKLSLKL